MRVLHDGQCLMDIYISGGSDRRLVEQESSHLFNVCLLLFYFLHPLAMSSSLDDKSLPIKDYLLKEFVDFQDNQLVFDLVDQLEVPDEREGTTKKWATEFLGDIVNLQGPDDRSRWLPLVKKFTEGTMKSPLGPHDEPVLSSVPFKFPRTEDDVM